MMENKEQVMVECEWVMRASIPRKAGSEKEAAEMPLTTEEVEQLIASGEYAKGSMEVISSWIEE